MNQTRHESAALPQPTREHSTERLPSAVTFFMTRGQRESLLRTLRALSEDRARALLICVGLHDEGVSR